MLKINNFFITQQTTSWIYLSIKAIQNFKVSLLSRISPESISTEKYNWKKNEITPSLDSAWCFIKAQ